MFINVGYVVGLLPVTGLQLPLISAGGTSTATTLLMIGIMANAARHEPEACAALRAGRDDRVNRLLRLPLPAPYVPTRTEALRDRLEVALGPHAEAGRAETGQEGPPAAGCPPAARGSGRARGEQPVKGGRPSVGYGAGQRKQGQRARTLEGQRHG